MSYEMYKELLDNIPGCIALILKKHTREIVAANKLAMDIGAVPGETCFERCSSRDTACHWCLASTLWEEDKPQKTEIEHEGKWYEGVWAPLTQDLYVHYIFDITERKKLVEDYCRAAQLAALGTVAAGVAHEINNPIQGIMNYSTLIQKAPEKTDRVIDISKRISKEAERIARITQDLLYYSKNSVVEKVSSDINTLTQSALSLINLKVKSQGIQIDVDFSVDLPMIPVQPQSFQQVIVNLVDNSIDALQAKEMPIEDKVLSVSTSLQDTEQGRYVCIEVYDNGIGMLDSIQERAKEAFFSTKPSVQGTGLGLSIVNDILHKHNGKLIIESIEGEYCKIKALFPVA